MRTTAHLDGVVGRIIILASRTGRAPRRRHDRLVVVVEFERAAWSRKKREVGDTQPALSHDTDQRIARERLDLGECSGASERDHWAGAGIS